MTILTQQLFRDVHATILETKRAKLDQVCSALFGPTPDKCAIDLESRLQTVFKDQAHAIFAYSDAELESLIQTKYRENCLPLFDSCEEDLELFDDCLSQIDFKHFTRAVIELQLHMVLSDPPIELQLSATVCQPPHLDETHLFEFWMYNKNDYYCIDGFPKEGMPCVVVIPPPYR